MSNITINSEKYEIIDTLEYVTLADSFVKNNKTGSGHGEAKLYVGQDSQYINEFFNHYQDVNCFILKSDIAMFLLQTKSEYFEPQQNYIKKHERNELYASLENEVAKISPEVLIFPIYRSDVNPPRVYINSDSDYYTLIREVAIPNISYASILKLKKSNEYWYYFKIFVDFQAESERLLTRREEKAIELIESDSSISERQKETIFFARVGQGKYRQKLLEECFFCPFTLVNDERLLIASHIKPWTVSNDSEKIDPKNGFVFTPTYDKLFDRGFISFHNNKKLLVSPWISPLNQKRLLINDGKNITNLPMDSKRELYLAYHRDNIFKK